MKNKLLSELNISEFEAERTPGLYSILDMMQEFEAEDIVALTYEGPEVIDTDLVPIPMNEDFTYGNQGIKVIYHVRPFTIDTETKTFNIGVLH